MSYLSGRLISRSVIIEGGREASLKYALELARGAVCEGEMPPCESCGACKKSAGGNHPDIRIWNKTGVDDIRALCADAYVLPNDGENKVYILENAGEMTFQAQNALLKTLEEPPRFLALLLLCENRELLLPTVRSRCAVYTAGREEREDENDELADKFLKVLDTGIEEELFRFCRTLEKLQRDRFAQFLQSSRLSLAEGLYSEAPLKTLKIDKILAGILSTCDYNVSVAQGAAALCAGIYSETSNINF